MDFLTDISTRLQEGDDQAVAALTKKALESGLAAPQILHDGLLAGMAVIGGKFRDHEIFLPDVLLAAKAMNAGLERLKPLLGKGDSAAAGKLVIGTVYGDLHDIGKNLVGIMLRGAGFTVIDLGKDVTPTQFVDRAVQEQADMIGMSALLTTTMPAMKQVVDILKERGLSGRIKTIIGGAPVSADYAREIGADAYAFDAANAVERVKQLAAAHA